MAHLVTVTILVDDNNCNEVYDGINALMKNAAVEDNSAIIDYQVSNTERVHAVLEDSISNDSYEEGDAFKEWVIFSQSESDRSDDRAGFWSNLYGWTTFDMATRFSAVHTYLPKARNNDATLLLASKVHA
ncbi:hypothetical protein [Alcaligenes faecalis]|nr:hypothetical protein [Alcaligenes faecalis]